MRYILLAITLICSSLFLYHCEGTNRYVSSFGKDQLNSSCMSEKHPCRSIAHTIFKSEDNDTIYILGKELHISHLKNDSVIIIDKSLRFTGREQDGAPPKMFSSANLFSFVIKNKTRSIDVSFTNIHFTEEKESDEQRSCKAASNGVFLITRSHIKISNCTFEKICTVLYLNDSHNALTVLIITSSLFTDVRYTVFSTNATLLNLHISNTNISGNALSNLPYYAISLIIKNAAFVHIVNCSFYQLNEAVAISLHQKWLKFKMSHCIFNQIYGQSILFSLSAPVDTERTIIHLSDLFFHQNIADYASSVHIIHSWSEKTQNLQKYPVIELSNSIFQDNYAKAFFGAVYADGVRLIIKSCTFRNNVAGSENEVIQAFGGALFVESQTAVDVYDSFFINNTCSGFGGSIFSRGTFSAINCEFHGPSATSVKPLLGDILYATAGLFLQNTIWYPGRSYLPRSAIWHPGSPTLEPWSIEIEGYFIASCPVGHNITGHGILRKHYMRSDRISMGCKSCPRNRYSLEYGYMRFTKKGNVITEFEMKNASCQFCKYGGVCEQGRIRSKSNYYGYKSKESTQVVFISCPVGYCCQGQECKSYDSCRSTREGRLCGNCAEGMSENLLSATCVTKDSCKDQWFWFLYIPFGIVYICFFMYLDKISSFFKQQIVWWEEVLLEKKSDEKDKRPFRCEAEKNDISSSPAAASHQCSPNHTESHDLPDSNVTLNEHSHIHAIESETGTNDRNTLVTESQNGSQNESFSEIVNITFYFYQILLIIRHHDNIILAKTFAMVKEVSSSIFTFSLDSESSLSLCPFQGLRPVTKSILIRSFAFYIIFLLGLINLLNITYLHICLSSTRSLEKDNRMIVHSIRLRVCTIQIILLVYSTVTNLVLNLVNCVPVDDDLVLFMDGSIKCFTWWQIICLVFMTCWLIPFPFALIVGLSQLRETRISYCMFAMTLTFPLFYIIYSLFNALSAQNIEQQRPNMEEIAHSEGETLSKNVAETEFREKIEIMSTEEILRRFEAPFKSLATENETTAIFAQIRRPEIWQGVMLARRLIIIILYTFINNPVTRLYCILLACLSFLIHHLLFLPYKKMLLNIYETVSSTTLVIFCSMNLFFAYSYVSNVAPEGADDRISILFDWIEVFLLSILPISFVTAVIAVVLFKFTLLVYNLVLKLGIFFRNI